MSLQLNRKEIRRMSEQTVGELQPRDRAIHSSSGKPAGSDTPNGGLRDEPDLGSHEGLSQPSPKYCRWNTFCRLLMKS